MTEPNINQHFKNTRRSESDRRRYAQNSLIVDTAIALSKALEQSGLSQKELAKKLGKSEGLVSQVLSGGSNLTLRTLADFAYGIGYVVDVVLKPPQRHYVCSAPNVHIGETGPSFTRLDVSARVKATDTQYALAA